MISFELLCKRFSVRSWAAPAVWWWTWTEHVRTHWAPSGAFKGVGRWQTLSVWCTCWCLRQGCVEPMMPQCVLPCSGRVDFNRTSPEKNIGVFKVVRHWWIFSVWYICWCLRQVCVESKVSQFVLAFQDGSISIDRHQEKHWSFDRLPRFRNLVLESQRLEIDWLYNM